ncbi:MAG: hypothetical protein U0271_16065 [Polyangiaceae bacterium]
MRVAKELGDVASVSFPRVAGPHEPIPAALEPLYAEYSGAYHFGGALLIRSPGLRAQPPLGLKEWNASTLWIEEFDQALVGAFFFAENALGEQFAVTRDGSISLMDPETAEFEHVADSVGEWLRHLRAETELFTYQELLERWELGHGKLVAGQRLVPRRPLLLGGELAPENLIAKDDWYGLRLRAELWKLLCDVPDGTTVEFQIDESS